MQHDQEFSRLSQEHIERDMLNALAEGTIKDIFMGKTKSYIRCMNVDCESSRSEEFYDIQLNVKGCRNLKESFEEYIREEILEKENKYMAEGQGLQDAKKGVIFEAFPPVLQIQRKRFDYDMNKNAMVKVSQDLCAWVCAFRINIHVWRSMIAMSFLPKLICNHTTSLKKRAIWVAANFFF